MARAKIADGNGAVDAPRKGSNQMAVDTQEWEAEVVDLKRQGLETSAIAEALGKHPATIRKAVARAREAGALADDRVLSSDEARETFQPIEGQTTVDDFTDDPDAYDGNGEARDPLEDFKAEAGVAVGPMQTRPGEEPEEPLEAEAPQVFVSGTRQMALDFGDNAAMVTGATLVLKSEKLASGHFGLGDVIHGSFTARIVDTRGAEKLDKDIGEFVAKPTAQVALITEIEVE